MRAGIERLSQRPASMPPLPDYTARSVCDVDFELLGKSHILLDLDLTIRFADAELIDPAVAEHLLAQRDSGVVQTYSLATNNGTDITRFAEPLGAKAYQPFRSEGRWIGKPDREFFERILAEQNIDPEDTAMIDDQYRLGIVGAHSVGITTVLVEPLGRDTSRDRKTLVRQRDMYALRQAVLANVNDRVIEQFDAGVESCTPYLFNLAKQLCAKADEREWDLIIGDDTSGRLVTRFVRLALAARGHNIPTRYFDVSRDTRATQDKIALQKHIVETLPSSREPKILVVTENAVTFETLRHIRDSLGIPADQIDFGILAASQVPEDFSDASFGGVGEDASRSVYDTFERIPAISRRLQFVDWLRRSDTIRMIAQGVTPAAIRRRGNQSTAPLTNLQKSNEPERLTASISQDTAYRDVAVHCYKRMSALAASFSREQLTPDDQAETQQLPGVSELLHPELFRAIPIVGPFVTARLVEYSKNLTVESIREQDVSVVVRTLNERDELRELLDDIHRQEFSMAVEIIVVDNESTDGTPEFAESEGATVVTLARNRFTYPRSMNLGVAAASHEIVLLTVGHARLVSRHAFRAGVRHFINPSIGGVYGMAIPNASASPLERLRALTLARGLESQAVSTARPGVLNAISAMISRSTWTELGGFDERYEMGSEDRALAQAMTKSGRKIVREPGLAVHHSHGHGTLNTIEQWGRTVRGRLPGYQKINRETLHKKRPHLKF